MKKGSDDRYHQGRYVPRNPDKYKGDVNNIICRSSWERVLCVFLDTNDDVLMWCSEEIAITYLDPVSGNFRRYYPDFLAKMKTTNGEVENVLIEIKPFKETQPPKINSKLIVTGKPDQDM